MGFCTTGSGGLRPRAARRMTQRAAVRALGNPPTGGGHGDRTKPSRAGGSANRGFKPRTGDTTGARRRWTAASSGRPRAPPPDPPTAMRQRSHLHVRISQTSSAPCHESRASRRRFPSIDTAVALVACPPMAALRLRGLSADLGIPPKQGSARLGRSSPQSER